MEAKENINVIRRVLYLVYVHCGKERQFEVFANDDKAHPRWMVGKQERNSLSGPASQIIGRCIRGIVNGQELVYVNL